MDDLGVPPWIGNLHVSYHNYLGVVDTVDTSSSEILILLLKDA